MIRISGCFIACTLTVTSIFGQEKAEPIPIKRAIEEMDKKIAAQREETHEHARKMIEATGEKESAAVRAFQDRFGLLQEMELHRQQLVVMQAIPTKGVIPQKTMQGWLDHLKKPLPKLPEPTPAGLLPDFSMADNQALTTPVEMTRSVPKLAKHLIKDLKTDKEKARVIFTWILENIAFDLDKPDKRVEEKQPPYVLEKKRTNCEGYAILYEALAKYAGLEAYTVKGWVRKTENTLGDPRAFRTSNGLIWATHAWNAI